MDGKSLDKALAIYSALITGQEVSRSNPDTRELYEEYYSNSAVYDITTQLMKKMNMPDKKRHKQHHNGSDHCKCKLADCLFLTQSRQYDKADDK